MSAALRVTGLCVTYGNGFPAVRDVSFTVDRGESIGLVGASGCGKTTILRALLGLLPADAAVTGSVQVDGKEVLGISERGWRDLRGRVIGYVAQDPFAACDPLRRVSHHVAEAWRAVGARVPDGAIASGLGAVGIPEAATRMRQAPHQWSGGMLQRATTLAATVHDPVLTLADEPTSALDAHLADGTLGLLRATSAALLMVTHDLALASRHTDRVVVLDRGRVVEEGSSGTVLGAPVHEVTARLVRAASPTPWTGSADTGGGVVVRARDLCKSYAVRGAGTVHAVRNVSIEVRAGEVIGIVGPSGSGKSTLLRLLAGMERPDSGELDACGTAFWGREKRVSLPRKGYVMPVFQDPVGSLDRRWPLWRSITEPLVLAGTTMTRHERRARAADELAAVGLRGLDADRLPGTLSVGQCQRVAFVRALVAGPAVLAADEPTASLDVEMAGVVGELVRAAAARGTAVLVVSHDEPRLRSFADRIVRVTEGRVSADD